MQAPFARFAWDYFGLVQIVRERTDQMQISRRELDELAGVPDGYSGKVLGAAMKKTMGLRSFGPVLNSLGLMMLIVEDPAARDHALAERKPCSTSRKRSAEAAHKRRRLEQSA